MNQMQAFIEKAKNDKELMAKLNTLGASGAEADKIVALAAEYGVTITAEDCRQASEQAGTRKSGELKEEDLEAAAGGWWSENRYDPAICGQYSKVHYYCVGFMTMCPCDHYRQERIDKANTPPWRYYCVMGHYDYYSTGVRE